LRARPDAATADGSLQVEATSPTRTTAGGCTSGVRCAWVHNFTASGNAAHPAH